MAGPAEVWDPADVLDVPARDLDLNTEARVAECAFARALVRQSKAILELFTLSIKANSKPKKQSWKLN